MTEEKIKSALAKVSAEGIPAVRVDGSRCSLVYAASHYEKRCSADHAAVATVAVIVSATVVETLTPHAAHVIDTPTAATQTVTLHLRPLPEKK